MNSSLILLSGESNCSRRAGGGLCPAEATLLRSHQPPPQPRPGRSSPDLFCCASPTLCCLQNSPTSISVGLTGIVSPWNLLLSPKTSSQLVPLSLYLTTRHSKLLTVTWRSSLSVCYTPSSTWTFGSSCPFPSFPLYFLLA